MTIQEFYEVIGGEYEQLVSRMLREERVRKYIVRFCQDETFYKLERFMFEGDYENAFLEVHNLKGMAMNIGIPVLANVSSELTEALRNGPKGDVEGLFEEVKKEFHRTIGLMEKIEM